MSAREGSPLAGRTSSFSGGNGDCVSVRFTAEGVEVGDSKHPDAPPMVYTRDAWVAFVLGVQAGEFEPPAEWVADFWTSRDHQPA